MNYGHWSMVRLLQVTLPQPKLEIALHRPSSLAQLMEFGLAVNERMRNNVCAHSSKLTWSNLTMV